MTSNRWLIDGTDLVDASIARYVMRRPGMQRAAGVRGDNESAAARPGALWTPKVADQGSLLLTIGLRGADETDWDEAFGDLLALVGARHRQLTVQRIRKDGAHRYADAEVVAAMEPQKLGPYAGMCALDFNLPWPYWHDSATATDLLSPTVDTGYVATTAMSNPATNIFTWLFGEFAAGSAASAPNYTPVVWVRGPLTAGWSVLDLDSGDQFIVQAALTTNEIWTVESDTMTLTRQAAGVGGGALGEQDPTLLSFTGNRPVTLVPKPAGDTHGLELITSGGQGATTALRLTGRRWYATA